MALTQTQIPQPYTPAYNDQFVTYISDQIAVSDFKYMVNVSINGGAALIYSVPKRPDGYLVFNAIEPVKNYIQHTFNPPQTSIVEATNKSVSVSITVKEFYGGIIHATSTFSYVAFDACLTDDVFRSYSYGDYVSGGTYAISFLGPSLNIDNRVTTTTAVYRYFYPGALHHVTFTVMNGVTTVGSFTLPAPTTSSSKIYYLNIGTATIAAAGIMPTNGYTVTIDYKDSSSATLTSESYTIGSICTKHKVYTVYYMKRCGSIDYMHFSLLSEESEAKKVNTVRLNKNYMNTGGSYVSNVYDPEMFVVSTDVTKSITLNSDWITEAQSVLIDDVFTSPLLWLFDGTTYRSVKLKDQNYTYRKTVNEKLFNYTANLEYDTIEQRQRGL